MQRGSTQQSIKQLASLPTASGGLSRLAANRLRRADIKLEPLLSRVGLTIEQIDDPEQRIDARRQIAFLEMAAKALNDVFLGLSLAEEFDCRDLGLLYYLMASSDTLGDALKRASRYSRITNEAIVLQYLETREPTLRLTYSGIPRHADRQQIEFCILAMVRVSRLLSGRQLLPKHVSIMHVRSKGISKFAHFLGKNIEFGSGADEIAFPAGCGEWALTNADTRLNKILLKVCKESSERSQDQHRCAPRHGREYDRPLASPRPSSRDRGRQEARDERADVGTSARYGGRDIYGGPPAAQGELGQPLFGGRGDADFEDCLASRV